MQTQTHTQTDTHTHTHIHRHMQTHIHAHTDRHTRISTQTHAHTHAHVYAGKIQKYEHMYASSALLYIRRSNTLRNREGEQGEGEGGRVRERETLTRKHLKSQQPHTHQCARCGLNLVRVHTHESIYTTIPKFLIATSYAAN